MKRLLHPTWIFAVVTLPHIGLLVIYSGAYRIIHSLLQDRHLHNWFLFGSILASLGSLATLYGLVMLFRRRSVNTLFGFCLLGTYIPFLIYFGLQYRSTIPWTIPRWMLFHGDLFLAVYTFVMPALIYGLVLVIARFTPEEKDLRAWKNFAAAVAIPLFWYALFASRAISVMDGVLDEVMPYAFLLSTLAFLFLLLRAVFILLTRKPRTMEKHRYLWIVPVSLLFPLLGLALNGGLLSGFDVPRGVFGDFSHPAFYLLAAINGVVVILPAMREPRARLALMAGRGFTLPFTIYFFLVFLPFFPLSVAAVIVAGAGFLMLTPLVLLPVHLHALHRDFECLEKKYNRKHLAAVLAATVLLLPSLVVGGYVRDRLVLHRALDYVYEPSYSDPEILDVDRDSIGRVLKTVRGNNDRGGWDSMGGRTPYLTPLYQYIVLDNLTLSQKKTEDLEKIFFGHSGQPRGRDNRIEGDRPDMALDKVTTEAEYLEEGSFWKTDVHLEIRNETDSIQEYTTRFSLPEGAWISDFYLYVGERKEKGILAEKRAALWVYRQITSARRDPGILYYLSGNDVGFRVFPFAGGETRKAGFTIVHRAPAILQFGENRIRLGGDEPGNRNDEIVRSPGGSVHYVTAAAKARLERVEREPYYHFVVDLSEKGGEEREGSIKRIRNLLDRKLIPNEGHRITLLNYRSRTGPLDGDWEEAVRREPAVGGFYLERGLKEILVEHHEDLGARYPIIVILSDSLEEALFTGDLEAFAGTSPETDEVYHLDRSGTLVSHSLHDLPGRGSRGAVDAIARHFVLTYPDSSNPVAYLRDDGTPDIIVTGEILDSISGDAGNSLWEEALVMEGLWQWLQFHPEDTDRLWLSLVGRSFSSRILTPVTSFIALENEAQKEALLAKQKEVLRAKSSLDLGEDTLTPMSEPPLWLMAGAALFLISLCRSGRLRRRKVCPQRIHNRG